MVDTYKLERDYLQSTQKLELQNTELKRLMNEIELAKKKEEKLRVELESWAPPFLLEILNTFHDNEMILPEIAMITFDIINSANVHDLQINNQSVRSLIIKAFSESVIKHGGWRESHAGDSAYAHFGMVPGNVMTVESAMAVASEFRTFLRSLSLKHNIVVEAGIALHLAKNVKVNLHRVEIASPNGKIIQKSFDTSSRDVDLVHRIEKLMHKLPGSNIVMTESFVNALGPMPGIIDLGLFEVKGHNEKVHIFMKASDQLSTDTHMLMANLNAA